MEKNNNNFSSNESFNKVVSCLSGVCFGVMGLSGVIYFTGQNSDPERSENATISHDTCLSLGETAALSVDESSTSQDIKDSLIKNSTSLHENDKDSMSFSKANFMIISAEDASNVIGRGFDKISRYAIVSSFKKFQEDNCDPSEIPEEVKNFSVNSWSN